MDVLEKVKILADAAKYDVSCSSSGSSRHSVNGGIGNTLSGGVCHSWSDDGRCISLLKILFSNKCVYDCRYCRNRRSNDIPRASFLVNEIVDLTLKMYRRNYIEGLFLSSGIFGNPEKTMTHLMLVARKLREEHGFGGYIHIKGIPGAMEKTIYTTGLYADRMSVNIELPGSKSLRLLAPQKRRKDIIDPMSMIGNEYKTIKRDRNRYRKVPNFLPAGHTTQMIVGASSESDYQIINLMENLYTRFSLTRVYYSAYIPVNKDKQLPDISGPPMKREHRLYQADWLLRFYKYKASEILDEGNPFLDEDLDPKASWALRHPEFFPVEINRDDYEKILRIPGVGVKSALRIIRARRHTSLDFFHLKKMGIVLKRAKYFITCKGKSFERGMPEGKTLRSYLVSGKIMRSLQLPLF